jgi:hypothetical protein
MMGERDTDTLLAELFRRNAPSVDERALSERISARLWRRRRRKRRNRIVRSVALGFASLVLAGAVAFGAYTAVDHSRSHARLVFSDLNLAPAGPSVGTGVNPRPLLARVSPVVGTAVLEQVKSEGTSDPGNDGDGIHRVRGRVDVYRLTMSQPAMNGTMEITYTLVTRPDGSAITTGSWVLRTTQGTWENSSWNGSLPANGGEQFYFGDATGTGGFEGLTLLLQWHVADNQGSPATRARSSGPVAVSGWIQSAK